MLFFLMIRRPPRSTRPATLFPDTTLFRSTLSAKQSIVATGARAHDLPFAPADGKRIWTYRHAMTPPEMPKKLLVIGSGAIGIELASFYNDMGADMTVVEMLDRVVPVEDEDVSSFRSEEHTSELQSLMRSSYAVFCLTTKQTTSTHSIALR